MDSTFNCPCKLLFILKYPTHPLPLYHINTAERLEEVVKHTNKIEVITFQDLRVANLETSTL